MATKKGTLERWWDLVFIAQTREPELVQELSTLLRPERRTRADLLLSIKNLRKPLAMRGSREAIRVVSHWLTRRELTLMTSTTEFRPEHPHPPI